MMNYFTYILFSRTFGKFYVGHTQNLIQRMDEHNNGEGKFTKRGVPWDLVKYFELSSRSEAMRLENTIKKRGIKRFLESK